MRRSVLLLCAALVPLFAGTAVAVVAAGADPHNLPIGTSVSTSAPARGSVYACSIMSGGGGAFATGSWIHADGTYDLTLKPTVEGDVAWPTATVTFATGNGRVTVRGNGLPKGAHTGTYPVSPGSEAYSYDRNPNRITAQAVSWTLPRPVAAARPSCLSGGPIGVALNGVAIFDALDAENRDAVAYEILDRCQGHPERNGRYHYHSIPPCLTNGEKAKQHSGVVGYALDGFPITGRRGNGGTLLSNADLDACHGHTGTIVLNGKRVRSYHYHATLEYPYTLGCFHGTPLRIRATGGSGGPPPPPPPPVG
jgi:hypothetical protein